MKKQNKIILLRGLPGSGKSYWCREYMKEHPNDVVRVNKDDLRAMMHSSVYSKGKEKEVLAVRDFIIGQSLELGKDVLIDDTNFASKHLERMEELAAKFNATVEVKSFEHVPLETCIEQDLKRLNSVGERVIRKMYNQYLKPKTPTIEHDPDLPSGLIVDMDGTLALFDRKVVSAYHRDYAEDELNRAVYALLWRYAEDTTVFVLTGRQEKDRDVTTTWLKTNSVPYDFLYMRKTDDKRSDHIIKQKLYNEHIKGKSNILAVIDDRLSVCRLWHELGLPLFRVGDPDADF